jgi:hypothetical protein
VELLLLIQESSSRAVRFALKIFSFRTLLFHILRLQIFSGADRGGQSDLNAAAVPVIERLLAAAVGIECFSSFGLANESLNLPAVDPGGLMVNAESVG